MRFTDLLLAARVLDLAVDSALKIGGLYYWLVEWDFMRGAICFGASGAWCSAMKGR